MVIYDRGTGQLSYAGHNAGKEPFIEKMGNVTMPASMYFDRNNRVWFYSWMRGSSAIYSFDLFKNEIFLREQGLPIYSYFEVTGFFQQTGGDIWVYGLNVFGQFDENEKKFYIV